MPVPAIRPTGGESRISFEMLAPVSIQENPHNARKHSLRQLAAIAAGINQFGFNSPVVVDENDFQLCSQRAPSAP